jgi:hypothetical protein
MVRDIVYLDLNKVRLLGFEREVLSSKIEEMVQSIEVGDNDFPPVPVKRFDNTNYALTHQPVKGQRGKADGGHHRAVAHYIANRPLKCRLIEKGETWDDYPRTDNWGFDLFPIPELILVDKLTETCEDEGDYVMPFL